MKTMSLEFNSLIDELIEVLEIDIVNIESTLEMLSKLRKMVIKRNENGLQLLLEKARISTKRQDSVENRRQEIRAKLAVICECSANEMTLTRLCQIVGDQRGDTIYQIKERLGTSISKLKAEQLSTSMLLTECRRFNDVMLGALLNNRRDDLTYNRSGKKKWQSNQKMDLKL